jgi:predicted LPLAT superfamily acyltransferase
MEMKDDEPRNPGPAGGYHLLVIFHRILPKFLFNFLVGMGSLIAMSGMRPQRKSSRRYLRIVLGREPTLRDVWRHFYAFAQTLVFRLEVGSSKDPKLHLPHWQGDAFMTLVRSHAQIFYGTFHIGCADLLGYELSEGFCPVYMIRLKKANSHDTERFERSYQGVKFLWANDPQSVLFGIHKAIGEGASITMQCDRADYASRNEEFEFFGEKRPFPITIYHLSAIYKMPVAFCFAIYNGRHVETYAPKPFQPVGTKKEILQAGREHFQEVLRLVEQLLKDNPYQWFNFDEKEPGPTDGKAQDERHA